MDEAGSAGVTGVTGATRVTGSAAVWEAPDARRRLQLALAAIWLLDAVLQYQSFMFTKGFGRMLAESATGNPAVIAAPITWSAGIIEHHPAPANAAFATIQLLLGLGIAWRPTVRAALAASIAWSVAVWWLGEGLGGVLAGTASPLSGAPGAVILYALLAVLLWPAARDRPPFVAAGPFGARAARVVWLVLWGGLAWLAVLPANRAPQAPHALLSGMADGEPGWLGALDHGAAALVARHGLAASVVLSVLLGAIAVGAFLPVPLTRASVLLAVAVALLIWAVAQDFGDVLTGSATDPNSGPMLALLAAAYWPRVTAGTAPRPALSPEPEPVIAGRS
jgi:hypothetical protein